MQNILDIQNLITSKPNLVEIPYLGDICTNLEDLPNSEHFLDLDPLFNLHFRRSYLNKLQGYIYACHDFNIISNAEFKECMQHIQDSGNSLIKKIYAD